MTKASFSNQSVEPLHGLYDTELSAQVAVCCLPLPGEDPEVLLDLFSLGPPSGLLNHFKDKTQRIETKCSI